MLVTPASARKELREENFLCEENLHIMEVEESYLGLQSHYDRKRRLDTQEPQNAAWEYEQRPNLSFMLAQETPNKLRNQVGGTDLFGHYVHHPSWHDHSISP